MGRNKIRPELPEEDFTLNPLIDSEFKVIVRRFKDGSWEVRDGISQFKTIEMEQETFTRLFCHQTDKRQSIAMLSPRASKLLLWLMCEITSGYDYLWINYRRYMSENYISSVNTYKESVNELCRYLFITPASPKYRDVYWINPRLFFCGSRPHKYPDKTYDTEGNKVTPYVKERLEQQRPMVTGPAPVVGSNAERHEPSEFNAI